jgi:2-polyprenyl-3-methyl-5-hydroxy-6-metoxy-1,4-benzoquinol methylase
MAKEIDKLKKQKAQIGDLTDDVKYTLRGGYHFKKFITNIHYRKYVEDITNFIGKDNKDLMKPSCLDVGCGDGLLTWLLGRQGFKVTGIDLNENAIHIAKAMSVADDIQVKDFFKYTGKHTLVTMFDVVEHLSDVKNIFHKLDNICEYKIYMVIPTGISADSTHHVDVYSKEKITRMTEGHSFSITRTKVFSEVEKELICLEHRTYKPMFFFHKSNTPIVQPKTVDKIIVSPQGNSSV